MTHPLVLVLSHPADRHVNAVVPFLHALRVAVHRVDTGQVGGRLRLAAHLGQGQQQLWLGDCPLTEVTCAWHRRPVEPQQREGSAELRAALGGILAGLPYLNHPADMARAGLKLHQLVIAVRVGLDVPETLITTARGRAGMLPRKGGPTVNKPLSRQHAALIGEQATWPRPAHLTQRVVNKIGDVRLTVVDGYLLAAFIESPYLDWRRDLNACTYRVVTTPEPVRQRVLRLMGMLRLRYGALDFAVDQQGRWWFLEINPNGQWLWIEEATGLPIASTIAKALTRNVPENPAEIDGEPLNGVPLALSQG